MNTARIRELLDEREYPITGDSPLARYALELRNAIGPLRTDLAYYQAKWEHELSTVSKLERERDALRREVDELRFSLHKVIKQRNRWDDACQQAKADADDAREEVNRITNNQRLQDSATAAILERAEAAERELSELKAWKADAGNLCIHSMVDTTCLSCMNRLAKDQAATIAALRQATRLCEKHQPKGGTRSACVICSGEQLSYALSRCSYACEEPNEMECSFYDVHMDEDAVVEQVKTLRTERDALRREVEKLKADRDDFHMQECAKCKTEPPYMVADVARRIEK